MKKIKQILLIFISVNIVVLSVYNNSIISYASYVTEIKPNHLIKAIYESADDRAAREDLVSELLDSIISGGSFVASSLGAIVQGQDFEQFIKNYESYKEYVLNGTLQDNVTVSEDYSVSISADLMSVIKQALREYSEETNGYWLIPTNSVMEISPQLFENRNLFISMQNLINKYGILIFHFGKENISQFFTVSDFSEYITSDYSLVANTSYDPYTSNLGCPLRVYNNDWSRIYKFNTYKFIDYDIHTEITDGSIVKYNYHEYAVIDWNKGCFANKLYSPGASSCAGIISKDGCRLRVFKSENAMKAYDTGTRTVYFGKDFYEKDPVDITITIDDLDKYLNTDFDKYFGQLRDTIMSQGSNLSEQDIEKLTDSILGKLTDIDNSIGEVGDSVKDTNNLLSQILARLDSLDKNVSSILINLDNKVSSTLDLDFSGIEERLDTIIMSLGIISGQLDDMTVEEIESRTDDALNEMQDEFSDIGELAKTKFPLSLPWDLGKAFDKIGGGDITSGESPPEAVAMLLYDEPDKFVHTMSLYNDDGIALYASENTDSSQGGGYFPSMDFSVDSLRGTDNGSHTSSGGHEHGGGGASRWGAWHSDTGAPIFYMPVEFSQSMKIGGLLIIDLSGFEVLHSIGRLMFSVIFCMNLVHLTFKAISAGKDLLTW